jgi:hypothetical protein
MKFLKLLFALISIFFIFHSCQKDRIIPDEKYNADINISFRDVASRTYHSLEETYFFDINFVDRVLDIRLNSQVRTSKVFLVNEFLYSAEGKDSILQDMLNYGGYPCWSCAELELFKGINYILIPTFNIETGNLAAVLAAGYEGDQILGMHYIGKSLVYEASRLLPEDTILRYWTQIFAYFDLVKENKNPDRDNYFLFRTTFEPCEASATTSGCICSSESGAGGHHCADVRSAECSNYRCGMVAGVKYVFDGPGGGGGPNSGSENPITQVDIPQNTEITDPFDPWAFWNSILQGSGSGSISFIGDHHNYNSIAFRSQVISEILAYLKPEGPQFCFGVNMIPDLGGTQFDNVTMVLYYALQSGQYDQYQICNLLMFASTQVNAMSSPEIGLYLLENPEASEVLVSWLNTKSNIEYAYKIFDALMGILMNSGGQSDLNSMLNHADAIYNLFVALPYLSKIIEHSEIIDLLVINHDLVIAIMDLLNNGSLSEEEYAFLSETTILANALISAGMQNFDFSTSLESVWSSTMDRLHLEEQTGGVPFIIITTIGNQMFNHCLDQGGSYWDCLSRTILTITAHLPVIRDLGDQLENWANIFGYELPQSYEEWYVFGAVIYPLFGDIALDMTPGIGDAKAFADATQNFMDENYGYAGFDFLTGLLGLMHMGKVVEAASGVLNTIKASLKAMKIIQTLAQFSATVAVKIKSFVQQGWKISWDNSSGKLIFKYGDELTGEIDNLGVPNIIKTAFKGIVDPTTFKNLAPRLLENSSSGNSISKTFINNNASKINVLEPSLKAKFDDIVANGDQTIPPGWGKKTENLLKEVLEDSGEYQYFDGSYNSSIEGVNGFDGVFVQGSLDNPIEIIINESKQWTGSVKLNGLNPNTLLPAQMTEEWVTFVVDKLRNSGKADLADAIEFADGQNKLVKIVTVVDRTQSGNANNLLGGINIIRVN